MKNTIVTYETFHGSAKKVAEVIAGRLNCKYIKHLLIPDPVSVQEMFLLL